MPRGGEIEEFVDGLYRVAQKRVSHHQFVKKIVLKTSTEIIFLRKVKV